jgi:RHS repeat-associated protein
VSTVVTNYLTVDGEILAESAGGVSRDYVSDPLGSVVALLDSTQSETDTVSYWPYGEELSSSGTSQSPFRYVGSLGYHSDLRSRRTYVRARSYAPPTGRWLSRDPLWPDESAYAYVADSPPSLVDPSGLACPASCDAIGITRSKAFCAKNKQSYIGCFCLLKSVQVYPCPGGRIYQEYYLELAICRRRDFRKVPWQDQIRALLANYKESKYCKVTCLGICSQLPGTDDASCNAFCDSFCW